jgi:hypothetical protein
MRDFVFPLLVFGPPYRRCFLSYPDLRDKTGYVSYVRQIKTPHIITKYIEINVTNIIITQWKSYKNK